MASCSFRHLLLVALLLAAAGDARAETDPSDLQAMRVLAAGLGADRSPSLAWSLSADPCAAWTGVSCSDGHVTAIQAGKCGLSGSLSPAVRNLTALVRLELQQNRLAGPLPSLAGLSSLQVLLLHGNRFSSLPVDFFAGLSSLQSAFLDDNPLAPWPLPDSLRDAAALVNFSANTAGVSGPLPAFLATAFPAIDHLGLAFNRLSGPIPAAFAAAPLRSLWLNNQQGPARLSDGIAFVESMTALEELWLHSNDFSGPLPDFSQLTSLRNLQLRDNRLTGVVPKSLTELPSLTKVTLTNNLLQGPVPVFPSSVKEVDVDPKDESFCLPSPGACDPRVNVLLTVAKDLGYPARFAENWAGNDPCGWLGIGCNDNGNITVINFQRMGLNGTISPEFGSIASLQKLLLSNNNLTGTIPAKLASLPSLKELDVSNNSLWGQVPSFSKNVMVNTAGNQNMGKIVVGGDAGSASAGEGSNSNPSGSTDARSRSRGKSSSAVAGAIAGSVVAAVLGIILVGMLVFCHYRRKQQNLGRVQSPNTTVIHPRHSGSDPDIIKITVAGSSVNGGAAASETINSPTTSGTSDVHVLEAGNMVISIQAKVADFGLVRLAPDGKGCSVETRIAGTFGYLAPEYAVTGRVTTKVDVFSFGVILMELVTGRKALDERQPEESMHLVTWFRRMLLDKEAFRKAAIDPAIDMDEETAASVGTVAELAGHCCAREPHQRPDMGHAVNVLSSLSELWKPSDPDSEESYGIDLDMTLPQALKKWQAFEDRSHIDGATSSFLASLDNTYTSIPTGPPGFADSFTSADGR
ncbi:hypothetical protein OPV22_013871 [Ensete ventricosum]|uniref:Protein kinase domain-containing protein n=1 Tax=Ensete ventricosum TaxID=4639 RepID=A0AAV8R0C7_ENSVE|nr:hypothetical protein OPV22_013871 [Ensete ventricosum]